MFKKKDSDEILAVKSDEFNEKTSEDLLNVIIEHYTLVDKRSLQLVQKGLMEKEAFLEQVKSFLLTRGVDEERTAKTVDSFKKYIWGYHVIDDLIYDKDVSDIKILNEQNVRIKRKPSGRG